jgi:hypothetical protein
VGDDFTSSYKIKCNEFKIAPPWIPKEEMKTKNDTAGNKEQ